MKCRNRKLLCVLGMTLGLTLIMFLCIWCGKTTLYGEESITMVPVNREPGSGTRSTFYSLVMNGENVQEDPTQFAGDGIPAVVGSSEEMLMQISLTKQGIGYVTTGEVQERENIKVIAVDEIMPTSENISDKSYPLSRSLYLISEKKLSVAEKDFVSYIKSVQAQKIIEDSTYVSNSSGEGYKKRNVSGKIQIDGSTSMAPLLRTLAVEYEKLQPDVEVQVRASDSEHGIEAVEDQESDFGMVSRELTNLEQKKFQVNALAKDGIAIIVNKDNPIEEISLSELKKIY